MLKGASAPLGFRYGHALLLAVTLLTGLGAAGQAVGAGWSAGTSLGAVRYAHSATPLSNGKLLVIGGRNAAATLASVEIYDPATNSWTSAAALGSARFEHTATPLTNGKVLVVGGSGVTAGTSALNGAALYDPTTNSWSSAGTLSAARYGHTATLLSNGKVLVSGGYSGTAVVGSAEIYNPVTNSWSGAGTLPNKRYHHTATLLSNGKLLLAGGNDGLPLVTANLYDPATGSWSEAAALNRGREHHSATLLADGKVLAVGGFGSLGFTYGAVRYAEIYDPAQNKWTETNQLNTARYQHSATLLPNGTLLVTGGNGPIASTELFNPATGNWSSAGNLATARSGHSAALLANGKVVVAGGNGAAPLSGVEIYDPATVSWSTAAAAPIAAHSQVVSLLPNGKVLVSGGVGDAGSYPASYSLYDPAANSWSSTSAAPTAEWASTTLLPNGKVLIAGGYLGGATSAPLSDAALFDPAQPGWSSTVSMTERRHLHSATLLANGKVLVAGGTSGGNVALASAEIYDPATAIWSAAGTFGGARFSHTATLLQNGKVLMVAGNNSAAAVTSVRLYDPASNSWSNATNLTGTRHSHTATLLPNGKVLVVGGHNYSLALASAELYDPASDSWSDAGDLITARTLHTATLLPDGRVLVTGGMGVMGSTPLSSAEIYDPASNLWSSAGTLASVRQRHAATLLPNGKVLLTGGGNGSAALASAELFDSGLGYATARRPTIASVGSLSAGVNRTLSLTGTIFTGDSEGASGAANGAPSNLPLVQLQRIDNGAIQVAWPASVTATGYSSKALAALPAGHYRVTLFSNGIPSQQSLVAVQVPTLSLGTLMAFVSLNNYAQGVISASGGSSPYSFALTEGALPPGYMLDGTGTVYGTATQAGGYDFTVTATDASSAAAGGPYSVSRSYNIWVAPKSPAVTISRSTGSDPAVYGTPLTFSASLGGGYNPTGTITFKDGTTPLSCGSFIWSGSAVSCTVSNLARGSHTINAVYSGDVNNNATSAGIAQTVSKDAQTVTFGSAPVGLTVGATAAVSATASSALPVTIVSTNTPVCTVSGTTVQAVTVGTCSLLATQAGNDSYNPASATQSFAVGKADQTISFGTAPSLVVNGSGTVSATASTGLPVTFSNLSASVCGLAGSTVTGLTVGTCRIAADQVGNGNYNPAPQTVLDIPVGKGSQSITFDPAPALITGRTVSVSASSSAGLAVSYSSLTATLCSVSGSSVTAHASGTCVIAADQAGDSQYQAATQVTQSITVDGAGAVLSLGAALFQQVLNPATNKLYIARADGITVVDTATGEVAAQISTGVSSLAWDTPMAVNPATNRIYVGPNAGGVIVIDGATDTVSTSVATGGRATAIGIDAAAGKLFVATDVINKLVVIDGTSHTVTASLDTGSCPWGAAVNPVTSKVYVPGACDGSVTVVDGASESVVTTLNIGGNPQGVLVNPVTNRIYVADPYSGAIKVIDGASDSVTASVTAGSSNSGGNALVGMALNPVTNRIYIANRDSNSVTVIDGADHTTATVATGTAPFALVVDTATNRLFVANSGGIPATDYYTTVTVIDGATLATESLPAGSTPAAIALNPLTHRLYVAHSNSKDLYVYDQAPAFAATHATTGTYARGVVVNRVTGKIYVANVGGGITVTDGSGVSGTVAAGTAFWGIAVNPVTNRIYASTRSGNSVVVIDGAGDSVLATLPVGSYPMALAVNPVTNEIWVGQANAYSVTVIDGATDATATVTLTGQVRDAGAGAGAFAIDPVTNRIYVATGTGVTRIDGTTRATTALPFATPVDGLSLNPATGKLYAVSRTALGVIDTATFTLSSSLVLDAGMTHVRVVADAVTNLIHVGLSGLFTNTARLVTLDGNTHAVIAAIELGGAYGRSPLVLDEGGNLYTYASSGEILRVDAATRATRVVATVPGIPAAIAAQGESGIVHVVLGNGSSPGKLTTLKPVQQSQPLTTAIAPLAVHVTGSAAPTFTFNTSSSHTPIAPAAGRVFYQLDSVEGEWNVTSGSSPFTANPALTPGTHTLYAFASDGMEASALVSGLQQGPFIGEVTAYTFTYIPNGLPGAPTITGATPGDAEVTVTFSAPVSDGGSPISGYTVSCGAISQGRAASPIVVTGLTNGVAYSCSATATNAVGTGPASGAIGVTPSASGSTTLGSSLNPSGYGQAVTFTATLTGNAPTGSVTFMEGATTLCDAVALSGGFAQCAVASLGAGNHTVTALYSGDGNNAPTSAELTETVTQANQSVNFADPGTQPYGAEVNLSASASSGLGVAFSSLTPAVCSVVDYGDGTATASLSAVGNCGLAAQQAGSADYAAAVAEVSFAVNPATSTVSLTGASASGMSVTINVLFASDAGPVATAPTGVITVSADSGESCSVGAVAAVSGAGCALIFSGAGDRLLSVSYPGDGRYTADVAMGSYGVQTVTTGIAGVVPSAARFGEPVNVTANVVAASGSTPPGGTVTFSAGSSSCSAALVATSGLQAAASCLLAPDLPVGNYAASVLFTPADNGFAASSAAGGLLSVTAADTSVVLTTQPMVPTLGEAVLLRAQVGALNPSVAMPIGSVTFFAGEAPLCMAVAVDASGYAVCSHTFTSTGPQALTASYIPAGSGFNAASASISPSVSSAGSTTAVTGVSPHTGLTYGTPVVVVVAVNGGVGTPTGIVLVEAGTGGPSCEATLDGAGLGSCTLLPPTGSPTELVATYQGDASYGGSSAAPNALFIAPFSPQFVFSASPAPSALGDGVTLTAQIVSAGVGSLNATGTIDFLKGAATLCAGVSLDADGKATCAVSFAQIGSVALSAVYGGDNNYDAAAGSLVHEVLSANTTIGITGITPNPAIYGQPVNVAFSVTGKAAIGLPDGSVTVTIGGRSCTAAVAATGPAIASGSCAVSGVDAGIDRAVVASFAPTGSVYAGSSGSGQVTIAPVATATALVSDINPAAPGSTVTLTASVTSAAGFPGSGEVVFTVDGIARPPMVVDGSGQASLALTGLALGSHPVTAAYQGSVNYEGSSSSEVLLTTLAPDNGACGSDDGQTLTTTPTNLCAAGSASGVTSGNSSYTWSCDGNNGGNNASCSAPRNYVVSSSVSGGNGAISASQNVTYNATPSFTLTPDAGFLSGPVTGTCGGNLSGDSYTTHTITADCTVVASYTLRTTYVAITATNTGTATASVSGGGTTCGFTTAQFVRPNVSPPAGVSFPHGLFDFTLGGCSSSVTISVTYPDTVSAGTQYWKYGPTPEGHNCTGAACAVAHWYTIPANISGNTMTFSITDGGVGDDDLAINGTIVDQGGAGVQAQSNGAVAIPTLSGWVLILLAGLLGLMGIEWMQRYSCPALRCGK